MNTQSPFDIRPFPDAETAVQANYLPLSQKDLAEVTPMNRAQRRAWLSGRKGERTLPKLSKMRRRG